jgi:hypothetical protein
LPAWHERVLQSHDAWSVAPNSVCAGPVPFILWMSGDRQQVVRADAQLRRSSEASRVQSGAEQSRSSDHTALAHSQLLPRLSPSRTRGSDCIAACGALGIARTQRLTVVAQGPIIEAFIEKRPEFQDLLGLPTNGLCAAIGEQSACRVAERLSARRTSHNALQLWKSRP